MTRRKTIAILLPSGVGAGDFTVRVVEGGNQLELTVFCPPALIDLRVMHRKWLLPGSRAGFQVYHPKFIGFETALKNLRSRNIDKIESTAFIALPFQVQSHLESKFNLAWSDNNSKMLYVDLKAFIEVYAVAKDDEEFELV